MFCAAVLTIWRVKSSKIPNTQSSNVSTFPDNLQHLRTVRPLRRRNAEPGANSYWSRRRSATARNTGVSHADCPSLTQFGGKDLTAHHQAGHKPAKSCAICNRQTAIRSHRTKKRSTGNKRSSNVNSSAHGAAVSCAGSSQTCAAGGHASLASAGCLSQWNAHGERRKFHHEQRAERNTGQNRH